MASLHRQLRTLNNKLSESEKLSILYHDIFNFPLTRSELTRWTAGEKLKLQDGNLKVLLHEDYLCLKGKEKYIQTRENRLKISSKKLKIAQKAASFIGKFPTVKLVAITGSLAMNNASNDSDIDLMVITSKRSIWSTRLLIIPALKFAGFPLRSPKDPNEKDKICLNLWLDLKSMCFSDIKSAYLAHEILQIVPLVNKENTFESFLKCNKWAYDYWPNAQLFPKSTKVKTKSFWWFTPFEFIAYFIQRVYMQTKKTIERVEYSRALFHPYNWSDEVSKELVERGVIES